MKKKFDYSDMVSSYFKKHLAGTKNVSINTIHSYRDTFVIFNDYLEKQRGFKLEKTSISDLSRDLILEFLSHLESERGYSTASPCIRGSRSTGAAATMSRWPRPLAPSSHLRQKSVLA